jgi:Cu-processing system ATP-binding protein
VILRQGSLLASGSIASLYEQAGLPVQILVEADGLAELPRAEGVRIEPMGNRHWQISVSASAKMQILKSLLADTQVLDVVVQPPTLDAVYAHFDAVPKVETIA